MPYQSASTQLNDGVSSDVKADADGVTIGFQSDGAMLVDVNVTDMAALDAHIVALVNAKHHFLASKEG